METVETIIIGSGIAGLSCAALLRDAGLRPVVLDKGRGIGGRLATRRTSSGLQFDHGGQYITAKTTEFKRVLSEAENAGCVELWNLGQRSCYAGSPSMNGFAKFFGERVDVRQKAEVTAVKYTGRAFEVSIGEDSLSCDRVILTIPAPQAVSLLGNKFPFTEELARVEMLPCLTLMAAFKSGHRHDFISRRDPENPLAWIALDSSKPSRKTTNCWVAQANPNWSKENLEETPEAVAKKMLPMLCDQIGIPVDQATYDIAHRWRYASVSKPLGKPFLRNPSGSFYLGGDWCLEGRVEAAWTSGTEIAKDILRYI